MLHTTKALKHKRFRVFVYPQDWAARGISTFDRNIFLDGIGKFYDHFIQSRGKRSAL